MAMCERDALLNGIGFCRMESSVHTASITLCSLPTQWWCLYLDFQIIGQHFLCILGSTIILKSPCPEPYIYGELLFCLYKTLSSYISMNRVSLASEQKLWMEKRGLSQSTSPGKWPRAGQWRVTASLHTGRGLLSLRFHRDLLGSPWEQQF